MDAQLKKQWLEALRSGKYDQGTGQLRDGNCFCCLGILCDIFSPSGWYITDGIYEWVHGEGLDESHEGGVLPRNFRVRCGIYGHIEARLIEMNDSGKPFTQIADYIEAQL
jgi:hypothetical protein